MGSSGSFWEGWKQPLVAQPSPRAFPLPLMPIAPVLAGRGCLTRTGLLWAGCRGGLAADVAFPGLTLLVSTALLGKGLVLAAHLWWPVCPWTALLGPKWSGEPPHWPPVWQRSMLHATKLAATLHLYHFSSRHPHTRKVT